MARLEYDSKLILATLSTSPGTQKSTTTEKFGETWCEDLVIFRISEEADHANTPSSDISCLREMSCDLLGPSWKAG